MSQNDVFFFHRQQKKKKIVGRDDNKFGGRATGAACECHVLAQWHWIKSAASHRRPLPRPGCYLTLPSARGCLLQPAVTSSYPVGQFPQHLYQQRKTLPTTSSVSSWRASCLKHKDARSKDSQNEIILAWSRNCLRKQTETLIQISPTELQKYVLQTQHQMGWKSMVFYPFSKWRKQVCLMPLHADWELPLLHSMWSF